MRRYVITAIKISFVVYLSILFIILFVRHRGVWWSDMTIWEYAMMHMNLIPFKTIGGYVDAIVNQTINLNIPLENLLGNLLMFLPMGIYIPFFYEKVNTVRKMMLSMLPVMLFIEIGQFVTKRDSFDIDDFLLNMFGAVIGYLIWNSRFMQRIAERVEE